MKHLKNIKKQLRLLEETDDRPHNWKELPGYNPEAFYGDSWKINLGKVFSGINRGKPTLIKKGLKEIKILNKKIEKMIEELI